jgi:hypothetical protein
MPLRFTWRVRTLLVIPAVIVAVAAPGRAAGIPRGQLAALVTVVSETGAPIGDLTAADFVVREDNAKREVVRVDRLADVPLYVTVLLDTSLPRMGTVAPVSDIRASITGFISAIRAANPGAQFSLIEVGGAAVPKVTFDAPPAALDDVVARLFPNHTSDAVMLEGIGDAARAMRNVPTIRKAIVSIDFNSPESSADRTMRTAVEELGKAQVSLWAVSVRGTGQSSSKREAGLTAGTEYSGGMRLTAAAPSGLTSLLKQVADSLSSQYLVVCERPDGDIRKIKIETTRKHKVLVGSLMRN